MNMGFWMVLVPIAIVGLAVIALSRSENKRLAQREAEWRAASAAQGWSFETAQEGLFQLTRWQGNTDGVGWTLEFRRGRHKHRSTADRANRVRWWADGFDGPSAPVLGMAMNIGKEQPTIQLAQGDGMLATLAKKAAGAALDTTLDVYFGEEAGRLVDARKLQPVEGIKQPGYIVMTEDVGVASRWLADGSGIALANLVNQDASALHADLGRPWVLWIGRRVMLAHMRPVTQFSDVERLVAAGVALTRSH